MSLLSYWQSSPGLGPRDGLKKFISDLTIPPGVTLHPMVKLDLVEQAVKSSLPEVLKPEVDCTPTLEGRDCAETTLATLISLLEARLLSPTLPSFSSPIIETGWYGDGVGPFLQSDVFSGIAAAGFQPHYDELVDQPWRSLPSDRNGMPGSECGHVYPIAHLDETNPTGPPMSSQLPPTCSPDFYSAPAGTQAQPTCLCLTNSTHYPAQFSHFISNVTPPADSFSPPLQGEAPLLTVPPNRVATFPKTAPPGIPPPTSYDFYRYGIQDKIGSFSLAVTFPRYPYPQGTDEYGRPIHTVGSMVPPAEENSLIPSQVCVGVSDAQTGAANANNARPCLELWYQFDLDNAGLPRTRAELDEQGCVSVQWTARGTAWERVRGWELKTLEAPAPKPNSVGQTYESAPIVMIPQETQVLTPADREVSDSFTYCGMKTFPTGLSYGTAGKYFIRIQPVGGSGLASVDAIDIEFIDPDRSVADPIGGPSVILPSTTTQTTNWQKLGKFTINYPAQGEATAAGPIDFTVKSISYEYANQNPQTSDERATSTFTLYPPLDNALSDFTLPGAPPTATSLTDETPYTTTMTMDFNQPIPALITPTSDGTQCIVDFVITAGKNAGDQGGQAKLKNGAIASDRPQDACWLELGSALTFVNGGTFQWKTIPTASE